MGKEVEHIMPIMCTCGQILHTLEQEFEHREHGNWIMKYKDIPKLIRDRMEVDELIFGNAYCLKHSDGTYERIDPMKVILNPKTKEYEIKE